MLTPVSSLTNSCYVKMIFSYEDFQNIKCVMVGGMVISLQPGILFLNRILLLSVNSLTQ